MHRANKRLHMICGMLPICLCRTSGDNMTRDEDNLLHEQNDSDEKRVGLLGNFRPDASEHIALIQEMRTHKNVGINRFLSIMFWLGLVLVFAGIVYRLMK